MQPFNGFRNGRVILLEQCGAALRQGIDLIERLDERLFAGRGDAENSSVGTHFRHNLDFVTNFLGGLESGRIDYNRRERDFLLESDRHYAIARYAAAVERVANIRPAMLAQKVQVLSETVADLWCESSVLRELEFLQSHTVHHYALIAEKLRAAGFPVPEHFGVAPSTLRFWKSQAGTTSAG